MTNSFDMGGATFQLDLDNRSFYQKLAETRAGTLNSLERLGRDARLSGIIMSAALTAPLIGFSVMAVKTGLDFESAFISVRKTVEASERQFDNLRNTILRMSLALPSSAKDIASVAAVGGQLGVPIANLEEFTRVAIDLGNATTLTAEQAITGLTRLMNIMGTAPARIREVADTLAYLGNRGASSESEILNFSLRMAGAGRQIGLTENQILGFSNALASVGIRAEAGGSSFSRLFLELANASSGGGESLKNFADIAGVLPETFKEMIDSSPAKAITIFLEGLQRIKTEGGNVFQALDKVNLSSIRLRQTFLSANPQVINQSLANAESPEKEGALADEAEKRYKSGASQLAILRNEVTKTAIEFAEGLTPALFQIVNFIKPMIAGLGELAKQFNTLPGPIKNIALTLGVVTAAVGPIVFALASLTTAIVPLRTLWLAAFPTQAMRAARQQAQALEQTRKATLAQRDALRQARSAQQASDAAATATQQAPLRAAQQDTARIRAARLQAQADLAQQQLSTGPNRLQIRNDRVATLASRRAGIGRSIETQINAADRAFAIEQTANRRLAEAKAKAEDARNKITAPIGRGPNARPPTTAEMERRTITANAADANAEMARQSAIASSGARVAADQKLTQARRINQNLVAKQQEAIDLAEKERGLQRIELLRVQEMQANAAVAKARVAGGMAGATGPVQAPIIPRPFVQAPIPSLQGILLKTKADEVGKLALDAKAKAARLSAEALELEGKASRGALAQRANGQLMNRVDSTALFSQQAANARLAASQELLRVERLIASQTILTNSAKASSTVLTSTMPGLREILLKTKADEVGKLALERKANAARLSAQALELEGKASRGALAQDQRGRFLNKVDSTALFSSQAAAARLAASKELLAVERLITSQTILSQRAATISSVRAAPINIFAGSTGLTAANTAATLTNTAAVTSNGLVRGILNVNISRSSAIVAAATVQQNLNTASAWRSVTANIASGGAWLIARANGILLIGTLALMAFSYFKLSQAAKDAERETRIANDAGRLTARGSLNDNIRKIGEANDAIAEARKKLDALPTFKDYRGKDIPVPSKERDEIEETIRAREDDRASAQRSTDEIIKNYIDSSGAALNAKGAVVDFQDALSNAANLGWLDSAADKLDDVSTSAAEAREILAGLLLDLQNGGNLSKPVLKGMIPVGASDDEVASAIDAYRGLKPVIKSTEDARAEAIDQINRKLKLEVALLKEKGLLENDTTRALQKEKDALEEAQSKSGRNAEPKLTEAQEAQKRFAEGREEQRIQSAIVDIPGIKGLAEQVNRLIPKDKEGKSQPLGIMQQDRINALTDNFFAAIVSPFLEAQNIIPILGRDMFDSFIRELIEGKAKIKDESQGISGYLADLYGRQASLNLRAMQNLLDMSKFGSVAGLGLNGRPAVEYHGPVISVSGSPSPEAQAVVDGALASDRTTFAQYANGAP